MNMKMWVRCDHCGWHKEVASREIKKWRHVPCPKCGQGEIISDYDMKVYRVLQIVRVINKVVQIATLNRGKKVRLHLSTANGKTKITKV
jgi:predicted RNA-binding Zn-ribbon protein involved in translation (DUF1610 family)